MPKQSPRIITDDQEASYLAREMNNIFNRWLKQQPEILATVRRTKRRTPETQLLLTTLHSWESFIPEFVQRINEEIVYPAEKGER